MVLKRKSLKKNAIIEKRRMIRMLLIRYFLRTSACSQKVRSSDFSEIFLKKKLYMKN